MIEVVFATRFRCVSMTPFFEPVLPEVKMITARASSGTPGSTHTPVHVPAPGSGIGTSSSPSGTLCRCRSSTQTARTEHVEMTCASCSGAIRVSTSRATFPLWTIARYETMKKRLLSASRRISFPVPYRSRRYRARDWTRQ